MGYIYYYDNVRGHSSLSYQTPFAYLKSQLPDLDDKIRFVIPIMLDKVSVELGPWSGYHVLAQHRVLIHTVGDTLSPRLAISRIVRNEPGTSSTIPEITTPPYPGRGKPRPYKSLLYPPHSNSLPRGEREPL